MGVPMSQINAILDMGLKEYIGWDKGYLPYSVMRQVDGIYQMKKRKAKSLISP